MTLINGYSLQELNPNRTRFVDARNVFQDSEATSDLIFENPFQNTTHIPEKPYMVAEDGYNNGRSPIPRGNLIHTLYNDLIQDVDEIVIFAFDYSFHHTRLYYLFKLYGFNTKLYVGTENELKRFLENVSTPPIKLSTEFNAEDIKPNYAFYTTMDEVKENILNPNHLLIDVRAHGRYIGESEKNDSKSGHIPTAVNIPNTKLFVEGNLSMDVLEEELRFIKQFDKVTVSCGSGMSATPMFVFLNFHNLPVKLYGGSFSEWITDENNSVETEINTLESRVDLIE